MLYFGYNCFKDYVFQLVFQESTYVALALESELVYREFQSGFTLEVFALYLCALELENKFKEELIEP